MKEELNEKYNQLILTLDKNDPIYEVRKYSLERRREVDLDSINSMSVHRKKIGKKKLFMKLKKKLKIPQNQKQQK